MRDISKSHDVRFSIETAYVLSSSHRATIHNTTLNSAAISRVTNASFGRRYPGDGSLFGPVSALIQHRVPERVHRLLADPLVKLLRTAERGETRDRCLSLRFA